MHTNVLFSPQNFNFKMGLSKIPVNTVVSWHFLICIIANPSSTSYKLISGEKETLVWENVELLPTELSKNMHSKNITHKHNITVKSQDFTHNNTSKRKQQRFNTHFVHTMSLSLSLSYCSLLYTMYYFKAIRFKQSWDSSAAIVNGAWARPPSIIVLFLAGPRDCFLLHSIQSGSIDHPPPCSKCTGALLSTTVPSGHHTPQPPSSTEAEAGCSHTSCPSTSSWCAQWPLYLYLILLKFQPKCSQLQHPQVNCCNTYDVRSLTYQMRWVSLQGADSQGPYFGQDTEKISEFHLPWTAPPHRSLAVEPSARGL